MAEATTNAHHTSGAVNTEPPALGVFMAQERRNEPTQRVSARIAFAVARPSKQKHRCASTDNTKR